MPGHRSALGDSGNADPRSRRARVVDRVVDPRWNRQLSAASAAADELIAKLLAAGVPLDEDERHLLRSFGAAIWWESALHQLVLTSQGQKAAS